MDTHTNEIDDWQALVNKPVYANDGREEASLEVFNQKT
jgi:hypothetical protein